MAEPVKRIEDLGDMAFAEVLLVHSLSRVRAGKGRPVVLMSDKDRETYVNGMLMLDFYGRLERYSGLRPEEN